MTMLQLVSFGLIADVQYSDMLAGDTEGRVQRYREAPHKLRRALEDFAAVLPPLSFIVSLGDNFNGNNTDAVMISVYT